jgi:hypothetical protein
MMTGLLALLLLLAAAAAAAAGAGGVGAGGVGAGGVRPASGIRRCGQHWSGTQRSMKGASRLCVTHMHEI